MISLPSVLSCDSLIVVNPFGFIIYLSLTKTLEIFRLLPLTGNTDFLHSEQVLYVLFNLLKCEICLYILQDTHLLVKLMMLEVIRISSFTVNIKPNIIRMTGPPVNSEITFINHCLIPK